MFRIWTAILFWSTAPRLVVSVQQLPLVQPPQPPTTVPVHPWIVPPPQRETGNLVFNSLISLLQHWPNAYWKNGHSLVLGKLTAGTLLYHGADGRKSLEPPEGPEWVSFDPEQSYIFGTKLYTFAVPFGGLKILYLDGSSADKMSSGTWDIQAILLNDTRPDGWKDELTNIVKLCDWGQEYGVQAFIRMEYDFEVMVCNFTDLYLVSALEISPMNRTFIMPGLPKDDPPPPPGWTGTLRGISSMVFQTKVVGKWHDSARGVRGVKLDYSSMISLFNPKYTSLAEFRRNISRRHYRIAGISSEDVDQFRRELYNVLLRSPGESSDIDWVSVSNSIADRYSTRLEYLLYLLDQAALPTQSMNAPSLDTSQFVYFIRQELQVILMPYLLNSPIPSTASSPDPSERHSDLKWLKTALHVCSKAHTEGLGVRNMTMQELLLKNAVESVSWEICRTLGLLWVDFFPAERFSLDYQNEILSKSRIEVRRLMDWLGWAVWMKCQPACQPYEICVLPEWPMDIQEGKNEDWHEPRCLSRLSDHHGWLPPLGKFTQNSHIEL